MKNRKVVLLGILAICIVAALAFVLRNDNDEGDGFPDFDVYYTTSEGNFYEHSLGAVGYDWGGEKRDPDGIEKVIPSMYDHTIPNVSSVTLVFSRAPDGLTLYGFGPEFAYNDRITLDNATSVTEMKLMPDSDRITLDSLVGETTYLAKAYFGDEYLYYLIPITDEDLTVHWNEN